MFAFAFTLVSGSSDSGGFIPLTNNASSLVAGIMGTTGGTPDSITYVGLDNYHDSGDPLYTPYDASARQRVGIVGTTGGTLAAGVSFGAAFSYVSPTTNFKSAVPMASISSTKLVNLEQIEDVPNGTWPMKANVLNISGTTITDGATYSVFGITRGDPIDLDNNTAGLCQLSSTQTLLYGMDRTGTTGLRAKILTYSADVITSNTSSAELLDNTYFFNSTPITNPLTSTTAISLATDNTGYPVAFVYSVSGTTVTIGTPEVIFSHDEHNSIYAEVLSSTKVLVVYGVDGVGVETIGLKARVLTITGTTVSVGAENVLSTSWVVASYVENLGVADSTNAVTIWSEYDAVTDASTLKAAHLSISGDTVTASADFTDFSNIIGGFGPNLVMLDANNLLLQRRIAKDVDVGEKIYVDRLTLTAGTLARISQYELVTSFVPDYLANIIPISATAAAITYDDLGTPTRLFRIITLN